MNGPSKGVGVANWLVSKTSGFLDARLSRRSFISRATLVGTAVAVTGLDVVTRPGSPYTRIADCPPLSLCHDGYTEFCCVINKGVNACPPNTIAAGWWRADYSVFCHGTRYYIDCNEICCGPLRGDGFCAGCHACECAAGCSTRKVHCSYFRYGQCHQWIAHVGPIACRMVTCVPPYTLALGCSASGAVDNSTAGHFADCAKYAPPPPPPLPALASIAPGLSGATVAATGSPVVFARLGSGAVASRRFVAGTWADWSQVGGPTTSGGSAVVRSPGTTTVFGRVADKALWSWDFNGSSWTSNNLGGALASDPVALMHQGDVFVLARLSSGWVGWRRFTNGAWTPWANLWAIASSTPIAVSNSSALFAFGRLTDNALWYATIGPQGSSRPQSLGGQITSDPSAAVLGANTFVVARTSDQALGYRRFDGTSWAPWTSLGGVLMSDPVAVAVGSSLLVIARSASYDLWYRRTQDGTTWAPWTPIGTPIVMSDPVVAVDGTTLHVFASFAKTRLGHTSFNGTTWTAWDDLGGQLALVRGS